ncbi:hypothetical protein GTY66_11035 [Streptomyces sp. SID8356]|uniref:S26 family signal peptidase n=1 Tax=Streptomyces sp. CcalMP-8W TaxID=1155715 RepID=UPI0009978FBA|nr:hypothetical protein [Streptomyces sp. SID8356]
MTTLGWCLIGLFAAVMAVALISYKMVRSSLVIVTVTGLSMLPTYKPGDRVLVRRRRRPTRGEIIVVKRPGRGGDLRNGRARGIGSRFSGVSSDQWLIKRVAGIPGDIAPEGGAVPPGKLVLLGDNASVSLDSRQLGFFSSEHVLGTVWRRF